MDAHINTTPREMVNISINELKILTLLLGNKAGLFGSQLVHLSNGFITRGSVYTGLARLQGKGYIDHVIIKATPSFELDRPLYKLNESGNAVLKAFAKEFGCSWKDLP